MYKLTFMMEDAGTWGTLYGAVKRLYFLVKQQQPMCEQMLETIWIEKERGTSPLFWDGIRKLILANNWVNEDGKWIGK